jgi:hypothetical protein
MAGRIYSIPGQYRPTNAQRFTPVVIHRDAQGNIRYPGHANAPVPEGFHKVELTDFHQIRKFEKEVNERERVKFQEHHAAQYRNLEKQLNASRDALVIDEKTGKPIGSMQDLVRNFSSRGKRFYDAMHQASQQRLREFASRSLKDANFYVEAFSQNSSNREEHRDPSNDWGQRNRK